MRLTLLSILVLLASQALAQPNADVIGRLRAGGFVLYLRHTSTDFSQNDARMTSYLDCSAQRNLTDKGREEARALGEHIKRLKIPIGEVLASPFCRTMETARLAFGKATATNEVRGGPTRTDDPTRYAALIRYRLPVIATGVTAAVPGILISYSANQSKLFRRAAEIGVQILNGGKAAEIPVQQSLEFDLVVNLKTANALGVKIPQSVQTRATRVIE